MPDQSSHRTLLGVTLLKVHCHEFNGRTKVTQYTKQVALSRVPVREDRISVNGVVERVTDVCLASYDGTPTSITTSIDGVSIVGSDALVEVKGVLTDYRQPGENVKDIVRGLLDRGWEKVC